MCNRVVQNEVTVKPGGKITVLMKGPGGEFELPFNDAIFGGPAKKEIRCLRTAHRTRPRRGTCYRKDNIRRARRLHHILNVVCK
jgi:hypothetical protein